MRSSWTLDPARPGRMWSGGGPACGSRVEALHHESYGSRDPVKKAKEKQESIIIDTSVIRVYY